MVSPPKPWERAGAAPLPTPASSTAPAALAPTTASPAASSSIAPTLPERPSSFNNPMASAVASSSPYNSYGSPYSSSPYNRFGSSYSPYGNSFGNSYGGGFGSYGGGYGGMNSMYPGVSGFGSGYGMQGPYGQPNPYDPMGMGNPSLTQSLESSTAQTFALIQSIVQTFSGVSQMLESTFMATHSSFFAMVGVVDQFTHLRNALGSVLGLFGLLKWLRELITGRPAPGTALHGEFSDFVNGRPVQGPRPPPGPRPSRKPLVIFLLAVVGVPWAMHKLMKLIAERQAALGGAPLPGQPLPPLDPSQLTFARALYPFAPERPTELALKDGEIVAIMGKLDPRTGAEVDPRLLSAESGVEGEWWKGRTRDGREGWFPRKWVEVIERAPKAEPKTVE